ncbi:hypothetical protein VT91_22660 [Clostridium sporogenes]|nr:hypothetical protein WG71_29630 [Clostridium sporogenes]MBZ1327888.1 hypothetical protein [Clostridium botulinum]KRU28608.1 hypothetical protein VT91_22660 [Clostridium sporogenes]KRU32755.1 hypothetical protein VT28_09220 [Clostridium sporogenes]KRU47528.1 hypothetical protein VT95_06440 [Clostridium sporogenes]
MEDKCLEISKESVKKILSSLNEIKILCADKELKKKVEGIICVANEEIASKIEPSLKELIYDKMKETKNTNPDLSSKLYILYRKYVDNKIKEEEAREIYETYIVMENFERIVW